MSRTLISTTENQSREGESGPFTYESTTVIWSEGQRIFRTTLQHSDFILDELHGDPIPEEALYDKWVEGMLEAPNPLPADTYVKTPSPESYEPDISVTWMTHEAKIYERLRKFAHPNICEYFGAIRQGEYCTGLVLRKYPTTLRAAIEEGKELDRRKIFVGILDGIKFIHSQGLVHNDIQPNNIMLDDKGTPIIIDFDGSDVVGGTPRKSGTLGWHSLRHKVSFNADYYSLSLIGRWLRGKYDKKSRPIENPSDAPVLERILDNPDMQLDSLLNEYDSEM